MAQPAPPPTRPIKLLMLHGYTQSSPLFQAKTGALRKSLQKAFPAGVSLAYPTAPIRLAAADVPFAIPAASTGADAEQDEGSDAWAWWRRKDRSKGDGESEGGSGGAYAYEGLDLGLGCIAEVLRSEGPFDGVVGFSQGGACAGMVASLLEEGRREAFASAQAEGGLAFPASFCKDDDGGVIHPPLKFAVIYSGFMPQGVGLYHGFYAPKIKTPTLHFIGTNDAVVEEGRSLALKEACESDKAQVVYHPGGHFLPSTQKASVNALIGFIKECLREEETAGKKEESVEDMDMPF